MLTTAQVTLTAKSVNEDGTIQVTFDDGTGYLYGDEAALVQDSETRNSDFPSDLKSYLICMLVNQGDTTIGKTLFIDLDDVNGNIVKVI
jgi:hypothetical protein